MDTSEADDEVDDPGALAAVGCLRAISTILESVSRLPHLFPQIEPTLLPIMRRMLTTDGQGMYTHRWSKLKIHACWICLTICCKASGFSFYFFFNIFLEWNTFCWKVGLFTISRSN